MFFALASASEKSNTLPSPRLSKTEFVDMRKSSIKLETMKRVPLSKHMKTMNSSQEREMRINRLLKTLQNVYYIDQYVKLYLSHSLEPSLRMSASPREEQRTHAKSSH